MVRRPQGLFRITAVYVPKGKSQNINGNKIAVFNEADRVNFKCDYKDNIALNAEELQILEGMTMLIGKFPIRDIFFLYTYFYLSQSAQGFQQPGRAGF